MGSLVFRGLLRGPGNAAIPARGLISAGAHIPHCETDAAATPKGPHAPHRRRDEDDPGDLQPSHASSQGLLDPLFCQMSLHPGAALAVAVAGVQVLPAALPVREELQQLIGVMARRAAWGGDRRKGSARIELSEGPLAGAILVVHTEQRSVTVELELPTGGAASDWQRRIIDRLEERGFAAQVRVG